jgi:beta-barrel assembly-enhancing protease
MRVLLAVLALFAADAALAQFDFGRIINKTLETGKKLAEANRDFTTEEEIELGNGITAGFLGATKLHPDQNLQRYVNRVGRWVALHSERPDLPWNFGVIDEPSINAFAMPGGSVLVSYGLVVRLQNESELAGVLAHEVAHVVKKHQLAAIQSSLNSEVLAEFGKEAAGRAIARRGDVTGLGSKAAGAGVDALKNGIFLKPLDRSMEYDADRMAVVIAARSGYDPYGLVAVMQMLAQTKGDGSGTSIFDTHPSPTDRLGELESFVPATLERYASQPQLEGRFRQATGVK